ncbi:MAG TPA: cysteine desulfurase [Candidatus Cybelea sp.]|nr:cysteine desulfurase [Candidatus Cybelea sp.]
MPARQRLHSAFDAAGFKQAFPGLASPRLHYLDNAATAQMPKVVLAALERFEIEARANVYGGVHQRARAAYAAYENARLAAARYMNAAAADEIVFTYGTTSAINLVANAFGARLGPGDEILLSILEHHSNLLPWQDLAVRRGVVLRFLPMTPEGRLDLDRLESALTRRCRLVALTHCSNVTGAVTDVGRVVAHARSIGAKVLLDGAQSAPHGPIDVRALDIDFFACSGHKIYGPTGIGILWARADILASMPPFLTGGQMIEDVSLERATYRSPPRRFEAGTPPISGAIGLGAAFDWLLTLDWRAIREHELRLTRRLLDGLAAVPGTRVLGPLDTQGRIGVVTFDVEGFSSDEVCRGLDGQGVALRGGHHCAQPLVRAFGVEGATRASLAPYSVDADVDALLDGLQQLMASRGSGLAKRSTKAGRG